MEFLTDSLRENISKLSEGQKEEIDIIESIINASEESYENVFEKMHTFLSEHGPEDWFEFFIGLIDYTVQIRPKERRFHRCLLTSIFENYDLGYHSARNYIYIKMLLEGENEEKNILFDFGEEGTVGRALFEDDVDSLQQLLATQPEEGKSDFNVTNFFKDIDTEFSYVEGANRIKVAALFGSNECFKYLMMNGDGIDEDTCIFAVAGGNNEIVHLCEQKGLTFKNCLITAAQYHRFELYEWISLHYECPIPTSQFLRCYNEPLFYLYDHYKGAILTVQGKNEKAKVYYYVYPFINAAENGHLEVVKYIWEKYHPNIEERGGGGCTAISAASNYGHLNVVKYLNETCHADVNTINKYQYTPIELANRYNHYEVVNYLSKWST